MIDVAMLQAFFFEAAMDTYASGRKAIRSTDQPWEKEFRYERGELTYVDRYMVNGEWSGGRTVILLRDIPVWLMQYHGWCKDDDKEVLAFLKKALLFCYSEKKFNGGRGLREFAEDPYGSAGLVYANWPQMPPYDQGFTNFQGRERIYRKTDHTENLFWHRYQGFLLGEPEE